MKKHTLNSKILFISVCTLASSICWANEVSYSVDANVDAQTSLGAQADSHNGSITLAGSLQQQPAINNVVSINTGASDNSEIPSAENSSADVTNNIGTQLQDNLTSTNTTINNTVGTQVDSLIATNLQQNLQQNVQSTVNNTLDGALNSAITGSIDNTISTTIQATIEDTVESTVESTVTTALNNSLGLAN